MNHGWVLGLLMTTVLLGGCTGANDASSASTSPSASMSMGGHDGMGGGMHMGDGTADAPLEMYTVATDISTQPETVFRFRPNSFTFHKGDVVNVTLKNAVGDQYSHSLVIDELGLKIGPIPQETAASKVITLEKTGTFTFYCDVGNHRQLGMTGTVTIS